MEKIGRWILGGIAILFFAYNVKESPLAGIAMLCVALLIIPLSSAVIYKHIPLKRNGKIALAITLALVILLTAPRDPIQSTQIAQTPTATPTESDAIPADPQLAALKLALDSAGGGSMEASINYSNQYLSITNNSNEEWKFCNITIGLNYGSDSNEDWYEYDFGNIKPQATEKIAWANITKKDGTRFNFYKLSPEGGRLNCSIGDKQSFIILPSK